MMLPILLVAPSDNRGRGVFAGDKISADTIIEISPVLVLSAAERDDAEKTILYNYLFEWGAADGRSVCIGLGYLSIYNHSYHANCDYDMDYASELMTIKTIRAIKKGEELFINYNAVPDDATPIWFDAK